MSISVIVFFECLNHLTEFHPDVFLIRACARHFENGVLDGYGTHNKHNYLRDHSYFCVHLQKHAYFADGTALLQALLMISWYLWKHHFWQLMAWCHQATCHNLNHWWLRLSTHLDMNTYGPNGRFSSIFLYLKHVINTIKCHYNTFQYNITFRPSLQELRQNINQRWNPQKTSHSSPWRASYRVFFVNILETTDRVTMAPHCMSINFPFVLLQVCVTDKSLGGRFVSIVQRMGKLTSKSQVGLLTHWD